MQISVQETGALERRMTIAVPAEQVERQIRERLSSLAKTAKVSGFRPGKVPVNYMERRYGDKVRAEVLQELIDTTFHEAVSEKKLRPVGTPRIESRQADPGEDLEYTAVFEVFPEIRFKTLEGFTVERPVPRITEQDIDSMIERMRRQKPVYRPVDRPARDGDQVIVDLGRDDGQPGEGHQMPIVIGSKSVLEEFEDKLVGIKTGEERTIEHLFPADYREPAYAGRIVVFHVKAIQVAEPTIPEVDDELARNFGIEQGGVEALRREVVQGMEREAEEASRDVVKKRLLLRLQQANPVELPRQLVDEELRRMAAEEQSPEGQKAEAAAGDGQREERARQRVTLGLMIGEIVRQQNLQVRPEALRAKVEAIASTYDEPSKVLEWYYADRRRLQPLESLVLEEEVVDWLLQRAQLQDKPMGYSELMEARGEAA